MMLTYDSIYNCLQCICKPKIMAEVILLIQDSEIQSVQSVLGCRCIDVRCIDTPCAIYTSLHWVQSYGATELHTARHQTYNTVCS